MPQEHTLKIVVYNSEINWSCLIPPKQTSVPLSSMYSKNEPGQDMMTWCTSQVTSEGGKLKYMRGVAQNL